MMRAPLRRVIFAPGQRLAAAAEVVGEEQVVQASEVPASWQSAIGAVRSVDD
jgi:hypothetical protein